jgi:hypothetical protein
MWVIGIEMREEIYVLHIGKTGGTAVRTPIREFAKSNRRFKMKLPSHECGLPFVTEMSPNAKVIFFIREPVSRFISGFNSRLRKGQPRHFYEWNQKEKRAFSRFKTPNQLAEALYSWNPFRRRAAHKAMDAMRHTRWGYEYYLGSIDMLECEKHRILFIGAQEDLNADFEILKVVLELPADAALPQDDVNAHRTPDGFEKHVSDRGRRNLEKYYQRDYQIYEWCKKYRLKLIEQYKSRLKSAKTETAA